MSQLFGISYIDLLLLLSSVKRIMFSTSSKRSNKFHKQGYRVIAVHQMFRLEKYIFNMYAKTTRYIYVSSIMSEAL